MKEIVVATTNKGKLKEISAMLEKLGIEVKSIKDVLGYNPDIEETGTTFTENAVIKAETVMNMIHMPTLADDSGLEVDALDKQPGIYSSRFMGEDTSYDIKNQWIIDAVKDKEDKTARFVCAMALAIPDEETKTFLGTFEGEINDCIDGENGFGYDSLFFSPEKGCTFAELEKTSAVMTMEEKNKVSHRAKALKALYDYLEEAHK